MAWPQVTTYEKRGAVSTVMGKASSFALGVCLSQPDTKVIVFGGDESLEMNLETLVTIGERGPTNWYRVVLENGMYATTGGHPIPAQNKVSFSGLAKSPGYAAAYDIHDLEAFATQPEDIPGQPGPVFVCMDDALRQAQTETVCHVLI